MSGRSFLHLLKNWKNSSPHKPNLNNIVFPFKEFKQSLNFPPKPLNPAIFYRLYVCKYILTWKSKFLDSFCKKNANVFRKTVQTPKIYLKPEYSVKAQLSKKRQKAVTIFLKTYIQDLPDHSRLRKP